MRYRLYLPGGADARVLDRLLADNRDGDVRLDRDRLIVAAGDDNLPCGLLAWRPSAFIHEFHVPPTLGQRIVAGHLMSAAIRTDIARRHLIRQAHFLVDSGNYAMLRYLRDEVKATEQSGIIFTLELSANEDNGRTR